MFGLTKREQRWKAEQKAAEVLVPAITRIVEATLAQETNDRIATLESQLAEARVELGELVKQRRQWLDTDLHARAMVEQERELAEARAEVERLRVDAERYRWLRDCTFDKGSNEIDERLYVACDDDLYRGKWALHGRDLDAAIDAAQKEGT